MKKFLFLIFLLPSFVFSQTKPVTINGNNADSIVSIKNIYTRVGTPILRWRSPIAKYGGSWMWFDAKNFKYDSVSTRNDGTVTGNVMWLDGTGVQKFSPKSKLGFIPLAGTDSLTGDIFRSGNGESYFGVRNGSNSSWVDAYVDGSVRILESLVTTGGNSYSGTFLRSGTDIAQWDAVTNGTFGDKRFWFSLNQPYTFEGSLIKGDSVYRTNDSLRYIQLKDAQERFAPIGGGGGSFLPLAGGTMSGNINSSSNNFQVGITDFSRSDYYKVGNNIRTKLVASNFSDLDLREVKFEGETTDSTAKASVKAVNFTDGTAREFHFLSNGKFHFNGDIAKYDSDRNAQINGEPLALITKAFADSAYAGAGGSFLASNGLTKSGDTIKIGGTLNNTTIINTNEQTFTLNALSIEANKVVFKITRDGNDIFSVNNINVNTVAIGNNAATSSTNNDYAVVIGNNAAQNSIDIPSSVILGNTAAQNTTSVNSSNLIGRSAGKAPASSITNSNILGTSAGADGYAITGSNIIGHFAGNRTYGITNSNILGFSAGSELLNANYLRNSILIGYYAGYNNNVNTTNGGIIHLGNYTNSSGYYNTIALGDSATNTKLNQLVLAPKYRHLRLRGVDYELPSTQGAANTYLKNNGSGVLTWDAGGGGGGVTSVSGTTNRITSTGGSTPIIDISSAYVGQNSIQTLGNITSGSWLSTPIGSSYGGAGTVNGILRANGSGVVSQATSGIDYEVPLSFSIGLSRSSNTITNNLSTGVSGGQTLIGSTSTNSGITYKTTTGVGSTGADHIFQVGNNGATEAMRMLNNANVGIGTSTPQSKVDIEGGLAVGATYSGTTAAPTNGAIIEGNVGIGVSAPTSKLQIAAGTQTDLIPAMYVSSTLPTVMTGANTGIDIQITSAGSSTFNINALRFNLAGGYTGSSRTLASNMNNFTAGTGNNIIGSLYNAGLLGNASGNTTGKNVGVAGFVASGNYSVGVFGNATTAKNNATNIGIVGIARNTGTSPIEVGGWIGLGTSDPSSLVSAGLIVDNSSVASPILHARDNGTKVFEIKDGGTVEFVIFTVSTLPTCSGSVNTYTYATVTDAITPTYLGALVGGGAVKVPVFCNGTSWVAH